MKTVFRVGMEVYDQVNNPNKKGKVMDIKEDESCHKIHCYDYPIEVQFEGNKGLDYYDLEGCPVCSPNPTLSTSPYTLQGFEQKAPPPSVEDANKWVRDRGQFFDAEINYAKERYLSKELYMAFQALKCLIVLREYYNEGWQPDWCNQYQEKFCIINFLGEIDLINYSKKSKFEENKFYHVLTFKTEEIRDKFLEEQRELLEMAKPLL